MHSLRIPVDASQIVSLASGDQVLITGRLYTARDAAHQRLIDLIDSNKPLPVDLAGQFLYYTGPTPPRPGMAIGSAGPTTSSRMDRYTPKLIAESGLRGIIGKGNRETAVIEALKRHGCVYFAATGGAGALLGKHITEARVVCYEDLGPEAIYELNVVDFPAVVAIDVRGRNIYVDGPGEWGGRKQEK
ncbi:MAG: fumarate hydratase C-terminal domain-containing protein [Chitinispirillaceae bacterium]|nr:fumarate hydratase C-terminal domain-containing protein [Chitinispirillaceae bacterium]